MSYGRRKIFTDETEITAENVVREVNAAYLVHLDNHKGRAFCPPSVYVTIHTMTCSTTKEPNKTFHTSPLLSDGAGCRSSQTPFFINSR